MQTPPPTWVEGGEEFVLSSLGAGGGGGPQLHFCRSAGFTPRLWPLNLNALGS